MVREIAIRLPALVFAIEVILRLFFWEDYAYTTYTVRRPHAPFTAAAVPLIVCVVAGLITLIYPTFTWFWPVPCALIYFCIGLSGLSPDNSTDELADWVQTGWASVVILTFIGLAWHLYRLQVQSKQQ